MRVHREAQFRFVCAAVMGLLSLFTVILVLALPKSGGDTAIGVVLGTVVPATVMARAIALVRGDYVALQWSRRASPLPYVLVGVFIVLAMASQFIEPRAGFAYYPALAGLFLGNLFREEPAARDVHGAGVSTQRHLVVAATALCVSAASATVWMVLAILANRGTLVGVLILASVILWAGGTLAIMRLYGLFWAPRRA